MHPAQLDFLEQRARTQHRIDAAKADYLRLWAEVSSCGLEPEAQQRLLVKLTDTYYQLIGNLMLAEMMLNAQAHDLFK